MAGHCDPEELIECPYNKCHMVRVKRFQYHLMKCRQSHAGQDYAICPFNAKREMPKAELRYHMLKCEYRVVVEREIEYDEQRRNGKRFHLKGCTDVPAYNSMNTDSEENWDAEIPFYTRMGVDPGFFDNIKYRNTLGWSKAERKDYYQKLKDTDGKIETTNIEEVKKSEELRIPNQKSKAANFGLQSNNKPHSVDVFAYSLSMAGVGRGRTLSIEHSKEGKPGQVSSLVE